MSVFELRQGCSKFQIPPSKNVLKPLAYNKSSKIMQLEKSRIQDLITQKFSVTHKKRTWDGLKDTATRDFGYTTY